MSELIAKAKKLKQAAKQLGILSTEEKNEALSMIAEALIAQMPYLLQENEKDMANGKENGLSPSLLDRLQLTEERIKQIANGVQQVIDLPDPIGETIEQWTRPNGLKLKQIRVPLGVVGMVYEARPNVTVDAASLCLKTGNAVLLRGSSSAIYSNKALVSVMQEALKRSSVPTDTIQLLEDTSRETAQHMFRLKEYVDAVSYTHLSCRRLLTCRSRWSPYH